MARRDRACYCCRQHPARSQERNARVALPAADGVARLDEQTARNGLIWIEMVGGNG